MGILDDIANMQSQGMQDREISKKLQEKGSSPKAIEDAFNQMRIKKAVSAEPAGEDGMEPSIMKAGSPSLYVPKTQEIGHEPEQFYSPQPPAPQFNEEMQQGQQMYAGQAQQMYAGYNQEEYVPQEGYEEQGAPSEMQANYDTDTLIEIAEQVFSEKIKKEQKQIEGLNEFATLAEARMSNDHERIKRIEDVIDKLQVAILEKIGSYGRNLETIKNEMGMMQESFEKMVPSVHEKNSNRYNKENTNNYLQQEDAEMQPGQEETLAAIKKIARTKK